jgi:hypothetical protein
MDSVEMGHVSLHDLDFPLSESFHLRSSFIRSSVSDAT